MGTTTTGTPREKLKEGAGNSFVRALRNPEISERHRAQRRRISGSPLPTYQAPRLKIVHRSERCRACLRGMNLMGSECCSNWERFAFGDCCSEE
jgi:hypothetical protein